MMMTPRQDAIGIAKQEIQQWQKSSANMKIERSRPAVGLARSSEIKRGEAMAKKIVVTLVLAGVLAAGGGVSKAMEPPQMVAVKGGCFQMGDTFGDGGPNEKPVHEVCVGDFQIAKYEVTQDQWQQVMGSNPSKFKGRGRLPVEQVSWDDAQQFIAKLNQTTGKRYRLPTEAEWEYAARSGGKDEKYAGCTSKAELGDYAWYDGNSNEQSHEVGLKRPNGLGLHDMSGNVHEWCSDWYGGGYYEESPKKNPPGPKTGSQRVFRGGSWAGLAASTTIAGRGRNNPDIRADMLGLRLALPAGQ